MTLHADAGEGAAREEIRELIRRACWQLDQGDFAAWLSNFDDEGRYEIVAYSPEIRREMRWLNTSREGLKQLLKEMPNHVTEDARRAHMVMEIGIEMKEGGEASALSRFVVFKTNQRGETAVYAVGRYEDLLSGGVGSWRFRARRVLLETRMFDVFPHIIPL